MDRWRRNYSWFADLSSKGIDVLNDQSNRGQIKKFTEDEARRQYLNLVVAPLGANRKYKPGGIVSTRVLFDGTNGILVNHRTRNRDQERAPFGFRSPLDHARGGQRR